MILPDVFVGITRFDQLQADLGVSRKVLTERLIKWLVDRDVLRREPYFRPPARYGYVLTAKGVELCDLLLVMTAWGDRWTAGADGPPVLYRHHQCGEISHVELRCAACEQPAHADDIDVELWPGRLSISASGSAG